MNKNIIKSFLFFSFFLTVSLAYGETCSSVGVKQYKPDGNCGTVQRECCRNGSWSSWGGGCSGAANCTSSEIWNGRECINCSNATVKAANKAYCCPSAPQTDTVCYKDCYTWMGYTGISECYNGYSPNPCPTTYQGYCTGNCEAQFGAQENPAYAPCRNASIGSECSESDYNIFGGVEELRIGGSNGDFLTHGGVPCIRFTIAETYNSIISKAQGYNLWCIKRSEKCKNGW